MSLRWDEWHFVESCSPLRAAAAKCELMNLTLHLHNRLLGVGLMAAAVFALLIAYCQLWAGETGVPLGVSVQWALITLASWLAFGAALWSWRDRLTGRVEHARLKDLASAVGLVFAVAIGVALLSSLISTAASGHEVLLSYLGRRLLKLAPILFTVAVAITAMIAAVAWRRKIAERQQNLQLAASTEPAPAASWIELPEAPLLRVRSDDVAVIRTARNYCEMTVAGRTVLVRVTAKRLEERLEPLGFARVHRNAIVNLARVRMVKPERSGRMCLVLDDGSRLDVSRAYAKQVSDRTGASRP